MRHRMTITRCQGCGRAVADDGGPGVWAHTDSAPRMFVPPHIPIPMPAFTDSRRAADVVMRVELMRLWDDMVTARRFAYDRTSRWSMECDAVGRRILWFTRMVGPIDPEHVPTVFLLSMGEHVDAGYRETAEKIGVPIQWPTPEVETEWRASTASYLADIPLPPPAPEDPPTFGVMAW
ncbi:hypothetical protein SEA_MORGANA_80 [Gordonia phage Morgana]|uniref:Uncharacterized protein n=1 Tax=Gordonia phage Morgana TaxID=3137292 RepID=A0AAX4RBF1_9CAUD